MAGVWGGVDFSKKKDPLSEINKGNKSPKSITPNNDPGVLETAGDAAVDTGAQLVGASIGTTLGGPMGAIVGSFLGSALGGVIKGDKGTTPTALTPDGPSEMPDVEDIVLPLANETEELASLDTETNRAKGVDGKILRFDDPARLISPLGEKSFEYEPLEDYVGSKTAMLELEKIKKDQQKPKGIWSSAGTYT